MPPLDDWWIVPLFVALWLATCAFLSMAGGWYAMAGRFNSAEPIDGESFSFGSGAITGGAVPVRYGNCLFATVGPTGVALSVLFVFRFLHPRVVIPWSEVERCDIVKFRRQQHTAIRVRGLDRTLLLRGRLGEAVLDVARGRGLSGPAVT